MARKITYLVDTEAPTPPRRDPANRKERGLLDYANCFISELRFFVKARVLGMPITTFPKPTRDTLRTVRSDPHLLDSRHKRLIAILQTADDMAVSDRLLQLPQSCAL
jgi:hypothetical protein